MSKKEKIISLNDFKENRKLIDPDGNPFTGIYTDYYDYEYEQKEYEIRYKDGKLNGLCAWWYENGQIEQETRYKDGKLNGLCTWWYENGQIELENYYENGIEVDGLSTELDENELSSPLSTTVGFIKYFCLSFLGAFLGTKLSLYIFDVWLVVTETNKLIV